MERDLSLLAGARERSLHVACQRQSLNPERQSAFSTSGMVPIRREVCFTFYGGNFELRIILRDFLLLTWILEADNRENSFHFLVFRGFLLFGVKKIIQWKYKKFQENRGLIFILSLTSCTISPFVVGTGTRGSGVIVQKASCPSRCLVKGDP
ncbi:uncharacterized protein LOC107021871 isoform X2 [Solanum pennellii]|uniref:Uncharacterized protein LOC107021871 isoform X2 n=1 Tax=Solanum pennellii TaxID=28526 RepID=A0ABM1GZB8_SOLPN|nr:uncharacterized protein LOC107021871 isoform X2 [Solanum pennellii]